MKKLITAAALLFVFVSFSNAQTSEESKDDKKENNDEKKKKKGPLPLDNQTYTVEVTTTSNGKTGKGKPDVVTFKSGKMRSEFLDEKNDWGGISYVVTTDSLDADEDRYIIFEGSIENKETEESLKINGTIIADNLEATGVWTKKEKVRAEYNFSGYQKIKRK